MLPTKTPSGGTTLNGFFVELPTLTNRIEALQDVLGKGVKKNEKKLLQQELDELLEMASIKIPPPPPKPQFRLTGNLDSSMPIPSPPCIEEKPVAIPRDAWGKAQRMFMVNYPHVSVRERPNLLSKRLEVLKKFQYITIERETDHWVKMRGGGWVLKAQQKFGQLIVPVKQQHYENQYIPASKVMMYEDGKIVRPFHIPTQQHDGKSNDHNNEDEVDEIGRLQKRIVVAPPKKTKLNKKTNTSNQSNFIFMNKTRRNSYEEEKMAEMNRLPAPPPKGWEMLLHRPSGKMYYASLHTSEVSWTPPPALSTAKKGLTAVSPTH